MKMFVFTKQLQHYDVRNRNNIKMHLTFSVVLFKLFHFIIDCFDRFDLCAKCNADNLKSLEIRFFSLKYDIFFLFCLKPNNLIHHRQ